MLTEHFVLSSAKSLANKVFFLSLLSQMVNADISWSCSLYEYVKLQTKSLCKIYCICYTKECIVNMANIFSLSCVHPMITHAAVFEENEGIQSNMFLSL